METTKNLAIRLEIEDMISDKRDDLLKLAQATEGWENFTDPDAVLADLDDMGFASEFEEMVFAYGMLVGLKKAKALIEKDLEA